MLFSNKRKGLPIHPTAWMKIKCITLSYRSQSLKATYCMILFLWQFGKDKTMDRNMSVAMKNWQSKKGDQKGPGESFRKLWCILILIAVTWCRHLSKLRTVHWQKWTLLYVNYISINLTKGKKEGKQVWIPNGRISISFTANKYF